MSTEPKPRVPLRKRLARIRKWAWLRVTRRFTPEILRDIYLEEAGRHLGPKVLMSYLGMPMQPGQPREQLADLFRSEQFHGNTRDLRLVTHGILDAIYREIFHRPVDEFGINVYGEAIERHGLLAGVSHTIRMLLCSREFHDGISTHLMHMIGTQGSRLVNGEKIAHTVSLGTHCLTSFYLKRYHLKRYSLPFDWGFASPESVIHCLDDDFKEFLNPAHYVSLTNSRSNGHPGAHHQFYRERYNIIDVFAHRDPTTEEDYQYYVRAVERFRRVLASPEPKLFIMILRPHLDAAKSFGAMSAKLREVTVNSAFLCVQMQPPTGQPGCHSMRHLREDGDHALYEFTPSSDESGAGFAEVLDDLMILRLIRQYAMDLSPAKALADAEGAVAVA